LIAYFLGNIYAENCRNRTVYVKIIASCKDGTFFETQCITAPLDRTHTSETPRWNRQSVVISAQCRYL